MCCGDTGEIDGGGVRGSKKGKKGEWSSAEKSPRNCSALEAAYQFVAIRGLEARKKLFLVRQKIITRKETPFPTWRWKESLEAKIRHTELRKVFVRACSGQREKVKKE